MVLHLSHRAEADLVDIGSYTLQHWGGQQAELYLDRLEACCQLLADNPLLGRSCAHIRPDLRRMEEGRHVAFYRVTDDGIVVSRIMHQRMLPQRHTMDDM